MLRKYGGVHSQAIPGSSSDVLQVAIVSTGLAWRSEAGPPLLAVLRQGPGATFWLACLSASVSAACSGEGSPLATHKLREIAMGKAVLWRGRCNC